MNDCCGMNAGRVGGLLVKEFNRLCECEIRVLAAKHCCRDCRKVFGNDDGGGVGGFGGGSVFRICYKGELPGNSIFDATNTSDLGIRRTIFEASAQGSGDVVKFHLDGIVTENSFAFQVSTVASSC